MRILEKLKPFIDINLLGLITMILGWVYFMIKIGGVIGIIWIAIVIYYNLKD